jgi:V/A-type H+-transporting ATPase subunit D
MSEVTPTRSAALEMKDERRAMRDGYVFLDEKCLLLAGEILRELARHDALQREFLAAHERALAALRGAIARHGLHGLQVYPPADRSPVTLQRVARMLMGVRLQEAALAGGPLLATRALDASPEADACGRAFAELCRAAAPLAAVAGNLERLRHEYKRSVRRARALHDVLLPELDHAVYDVETRLEELEQEDAIGMRRSAGPVDSTAR